MVITEIAVTAVETATVPQIGQQLSNINTLKRH